MVDILAASEEALPQLTKTTERLGQVMEWIGQLTPRRPRQRLTVGLPHRQDRILIVAFEVLDLPMKIGEQTRTWASLRQVKELRLPLFEQMVYLDHPRHGPFVF
jgi:hypothetical protein